MAFVTPDVSEVQDNVAPGTYTARVTQADVDTWEGKEGKPDVTFIKWVCETYGESEDKNNGRKIFHRTPITGKGAFRFKEFYKACTGEEYSGGDFDTEQLIGKEAKFVLVDGVDKDKQPTGYTEVKKVLPIH